MAGRVVGQPPDDQFPAEAAAQAFRGIERLLIARAFFAWDEQQAMYRVQRAIADAARSAGADLSGGA